MLVSGLGRHAFSFSDAVTRGISTVIAPGNLHRKRNNIAVPRQKVREDMGLCSFQVDLGATHSSQNAVSAPMALRTQTSADIWHRTGTHERHSMDLLHRKDGNGIDYTGTVTGRPTCALGKSQQKAHPKKTVHKTQGPVELVYKS